MAKIVGIEGMAANELSQAISEGGRFVAYQYVVSVLVLTFRRSSDIYFLRPGANAVVKGLPWTALTFIFGWWGLPWGLIYTPVVLFKNLSGGIDVSDAVCLQQFGMTASAMRLPRSTVGSPA